MLRFVRSWSAISRSLPQFTPARRPHARRLPTLERLEDRAMLSTISIPVTSLADSGAGTLRAAITQANSGTATNSYVIPIKVEGTIDLLSHLPDLSNNIAIRGPGSSLLTIAHGFAASYNWPIFGTATTEIQFTINISGLSFTNGVNDFGGDIENTNSIMTISNCTFENSIAAFGGAISTNVSMTIIHCDFYNNGADWGGGAIFISNFDATVTVIDSSFEHNAANTPNPGYGGAIYNQGTELILIGDTFQYNSAFDGGAIYNDDWSFNINGVASYSTVTVIGSTFDSNYAYADGGGLDNDGTATVIGSTFTGNYATVDGGGIFNDATLTVTNSTFTSNSAGSVGGGLYNDITTTVIDSTFTSNSAIGGGGIANWNGGTLTVSGSTFTNDAAASSGGGIDNVSSSTVMVRSSIFTGNSAGNAGGGIDNSDGKLMVIRSIFIHNSTNVGGGIYNVSTATVIDSFFAYNTATNGGGIYNAGTLIDTGNVFFDNT